MKLDCPDFGALFEAHIHCALMQRSLGDSRPNPPLQLTPLRGPKIAAILKSGNGPNVISIYEWRRN